MVQVTMESRRVCQMCNRSATICILSTPDQPPFYNKFSCRVSDSFWRPGRSDSLRLSHKQLHRNSQGSPCRLAAQYAGMLSIRSRLR